MAEMTMSGSAGRMAYYVPRLGFLLAVVALVLLALAPIGWRSGMLHFRTTFFYLMQPAAYVGIAAGVVSLIALIWWGAMTATGRLMAVVGVVLGALMFYVPWYYNHVLNTVPRIHDITTDIETPPTFSAVVLQARAAEKESNSVEYDAKVGAQQKEAYPDLAPVKTALPPAEAFKRALATAQAMSGWTIVANDPASGRIEGQQRTLFMGFTDDFVIRVVADGAGSRVDMRSESRQGRSDFGVNAARIRSYMTALKPTLG
jgi:uncharacterized protein (DUF1499 family)